MLKRTFEILLIFFMAINLSSCGSKIGVGEIKNGLAETKEKQENFEIDNNSVYPGFESTPELESQQNVYDFELEEVYVSKITDYFEKFSFVPANEDVSSSGDDTFYRGNNMKPGEGVISIEPLIISDQNMFLALTMQANENKDPEFGFLYWTIEAHLYSVLGEDIIPVDRLYITDIFHSVNRINILLNIYNDEYWLFSERNYRVAMSSGSNSFLSVKITPEGFVEQADLSVNSSPNSLTLTQRGETQKYIDDYKQPESEYGDFAGDLISIYEESFYDHPTILTDNNILPIGKTTKLLNIYRADNMFVMLNSAEYGYNNSIVYSELFKEETTDQTTKEKQEINAEEITFWNPAKGNDLFLLMNNFGKMMDQKYYEYWPSNNYSLFGLDVPDGVIGPNKVWEIAFSETSSYESAEMRPTIDVRWSQDGVSSHAEEYALVAIYAGSSLDTSNNQAFVYLFTIKDGEPFVLFTSQNEGIDMRLHVQETENIFLRDSFANIVNSD